MTSLIRPHDILRKLRFSRTSTRITPAGLPVMDAPLSTVLTRLRKYVQYWIHTDCVAAITSADEERSLKFRQWTHRTENLHFRKSDKPEGCTGCIPRLIGSFSPRSLCRSTLLHGLKSEIRNCESRFLTYGLSPCVANTQANHCPGSTMCSHSHVFSRI
jgi:hypothetical protein